jgi:hypothetical protein
VARTRLLMTAVYVVVFLSVAMLGFWAGKRVAACEMAGEGLRLETGWVPWSGCRATFMGSTVKVDG